MPAMPHVVYAEFLHETNSFSVRRTGEVAFAAGQLAWGDAAVRAAFAGTRTAAGAALDAAARHGWTLHTPVVAEATPSGPVEPAWFERVAAVIVAALHDGPLDGVLLHLHGSMATPETHDADGALLQRVRAAAGPRVPVIVVLDLRATITPRMVAQVQSVVAYRTYPHVDLAARVAQAAALLDDAMAGRVQPLAVLDRAPLLNGCDGGRTTDAALPMRRLLARADALEAEGEALVVSVQAGFSSIDSPDIGPSVVVTTDKTQDPEAQTARRIAREFAGLIWATRDETSHRFTPLADAMARAAQGQDGARAPLVIADHADNPGAGAYGDATAVLAAMLGARLRNAVFFAIHDPEAVATASGAGVGATLTLALGGKVAPGMGGGPLTLTGQVRHASDGRFRADGPMGGGAWRHVGTTVVFQVDGVAIVLASSNHQANDLAQLTSLGIDPLACATIALKSMQHFKAAFGPVAREIIEVDSGALCTRNYLARPYTRVRRPIYPLDPDTCHDLD